jgi:hypothetical protein
MKEEDDGLVELSRIHAEDLAPQQPREMSPLTPLLDRNLHLATEPKRHAHD